MMYKFSGFHSPLTEMTSTRARRAARVLMLTEVLLMLSEPGEKRRPVWRLKMIWLQCIGWSLIWKIQEWLKRCHIRFRESHWHLHSLKTRLFLFFIGFLQKTSTLPHMFCLKSVSRNSIDRDRDVTWKKLSFTFFFQPNQFSSPIMYPACSSLKHSRGAKG